MPQPGNRPARSTPPLFEGVSWQAGIEGIAARPASGA